jgi:hypothetical protein
VTATRSLTRLIAALLAAVLLLAACGSDSGDDAADAAEDGGGDASVLDDTQDDGESDDGGDDGESDDGGGDAGGGGVSGDTPEGFVEAEWATGTAHIDVSGDIDMAVDYAQGGGYTATDQMSLSFFGTDSNEALGVLIQPGGGGGITWGTGQMAAGGQYPSGCDIGLTKNDATEIAGTFLCEDVPGVDGATNVTVTLEGTFSVKAA